MIETAMLKGRCLIAASVLLLGATVAASASTYTVTLTQVTTGSVTNVDATGSGSIDTTDLTADPRSFTYAGAGVVPSLGFISTGPTTAGAPITGYTGFMGPTSIGPGSAMLATTGSGDDVLIIGSSGTYGKSLLWVPDGYLSGASLLDTATYDNATLAMLGVTPGTYTWTWGSGADAGSFVLDVVAPTTTPLPAALPLFATGLGGLGPLGWRRKRKAQAV